MRKICRSGFIIVWAALGAGVTLASAHCKIERFPALRITFVHGHPTTTALIDAAAHITVDHWWHFW